MLCCDQLPTYAKARITDPVDGSITIDYFVDVGTPPKHCTPLLNEDDIPDLTCWR